MFRPVIALMLAAAPLGAGQSQSRELEGWKFDGEGKACMVHATSAQGTMVSVWAFAGQAKIGFLLQNRDWNSLQDGRRYDLKLDFAGVKAWPVEATAREHIDSDGPGFFFAVNPGASGGANFLEAFATAKGLRISRDGRAMDNMTLAGSRDAMNALAQCLAKNWGAAEAGEPEPESDEEPVITV